MAFALCTAQVAAAQPLTPAIGRVAEPPPTAGSVARIVAVGDSVMWGQGLNPEDKFAAQIAAQYPQLLGRKAALEMRAHSGSTLATRQDDSLKALVDADSEVPRHDRSVATQLAEVPHPETVDLLLVNGCINDISPTNLVLRSLGAAPQSYWKAEATEKCLVEMTLQLKFALGRFPKAKIIVTGYYPLFVKAPSPAPAKGALGKAQQLLERVADADLPDALLTKVIRWACGSTHAHCIAGLMLAKDELRGGLVLKSKWWVEESDKALSKAVDDANAAAGSRRVAFAPVHLAPGDGIGQPNAKLWGFGQVDPQLKHRVAACEAAHKAEPKLDPAECSVAAVFHPNVAGSKLYAASVAAAVRSFVAAR